MENDDKISDSGPSSPSPDLEPQGMSPQQADTLNGPVNVNVALLFQFFTGMKPALGRIQRLEMAASKVCKLCSYVWFFWYPFWFLTTSSQKHGADKSTLPGVANFIYRPSTTNSILQRHLYQVHPREYDDAASHFVVADKVSLESQHSINLRWLLTTSGPAVTRLSLSGFCH